MHCSKCSFTVVEAKCLRRVDCNKQEAVCLARLNVQHSIKLPARCKSLAHIQVVAKQMTARQEPVRTWLTCTWTTVPGLRAARGLILIADPVSISSAGMGMVHNLRHC